MRRHTTPVVVVVLLALAVLVPMRACLAQPAAAAPEVKPAPAPAAAVAVEVKPAEGDDLAALVQQYEAMGMDEKTATMMAMMNSDDGDMSSLLPLLMMGQGGGGGGDAMGMLFFSQMMKGSQQSAQPFVTFTGNLADGLMVIIDRGVIYKVDLASMKVIGQLAYRKKPGLKLSPMAMAPMMAKARDQAMQTACLSNVKQICLGFLMYAQDYDEVLPPATWAADLQPYLKNTQIMICPARPEAKVGYAFNKALLKAHLADIKAPSETILVFEAKTKAADFVATADDVPPEGVHDGGICVGYADGHAKWLSVNDAREALKRPIK
jgi:hypothetical protein